MASIFGHGLVGFTISKTIKWQSSKLLLVMAIVSAILPDADVLGFSLGIPYKHPLGHRGSTHSIVFAVLWAGLITWLFKSHRLKVYSIIFLSTISHGILDAFTTGGEGVGFFIPLNNERFFFSKKVIQVSPIGVDKFFSEWGLRVILSELKYIAMPCVIVLIVLLFLHKLKIYQNDR